MVVIRSIWRLILQCSRRELLPACVFPEPRSLSKKKKKNWHRDFKKCLSVNSTDNPSNVIHPNSIHCIWLHSLCLLYKMPKSRATSWAHKTRDSWKLSAVSFFSFLTALITTEIQHHEGMFLLISLMSKTRKQGDMNFHVSGRDTSS